MMREFWGETATLFQSTSAMYRLTKKLKALKQPIRELSQAKLGELPGRVKEAFEYLCMKQKETMEAPTVEAIREESKALKRWKTLADLEEAFFKQSAKLHWLTVGDQNTKVFHNTVKIREVRNAIHELRRSDGSIIKGEEVKVEAKRYFTEFLNYKPENYEGVSVERLQELLQSSCSDLDKKQKGRLQRKK